MIPPNARHPAPKTTSTVHTKPAIVLRVGQPPVVEHLKCERVERYPGTGHVWAVHYLELQRIVGGNFDMARVHPELVAELERRLDVELGTGEEGFTVMLVCHDEGAIRGMPVNELATKLYGGGHAWDICGDALLVEVD